MSHQTHEEASSLQTSELKTASDNFIKLYNARVAFFTDAFIKKVEARDRKALAALTRYPLPPTQMDLRAELTKLLQSGVAENHSLFMNDGKIYTVGQLKGLAPHWAAVAEKALIESDPALADKLMTVLQWNAKSAFEVTFTTAANELKEIRKSKQVSSTLDHYETWIIGPLEKAMERVREVNTPGNALIGYGNKISLSQALKEAKNFREEFRKVCEKRKK